MVEGCWIGWRVINDGFWEASDIFGDGDKALNGEITILAEFLKRSQIIHPT